MKGVFWAKLSRSGGQKFHVLAIFGDQLSCTSDKMKFIYWNVQLADACFRSTEYPFT
jgi:hypothetical protein